MCTYSIQMYMYGTHTLLGTFRLYIYMYVHVGAYSLILL